jgi:ABC-type metal ion transport system substrate-binding protein
MLLVHLLVNCFAHRPLLETAWRYNHLNMPEIVPVIFFPLACASGKITKKSS